MCHFWSIQICSKQMAFINKVFRLSENIRIITRNSYLKTSFSENQYVRYYGTYPAICNRTPKILKKTKIWILLNIIWNTTISIIPLIQSYEILIHFVMFWLSWRIFFFSLNKSFYISFFLLHSDWKTILKIMLFACFLLFLPYYFSSY